MKEVYLFLTNGFEEIEALGTIDILRRGGVDVKSVSIVDGKQVNGSHGIPVIADMMFNEVDFAKAEMLVIPGGTPKFNDHEGLKKAVLAFAQKGEKVAAICAAPMVLGGLGLLKGKKATAYPGFEQYLDGAEFIKTPVVVDGNITTGRGPGFTMDFALKLLEILRGKAKSDEVAGQLLLK
ncbi:DJ-1/PfpI family protein [Dysgonomonas sp. 216]|uniref:DJ-1 family glyoxalase III n=1 Tax=Dysgonomonas sp. 216 TaxID=2302934 RepID=UPI0013D0AC40|nr:DJ-1 family glyoxalase III [Dysgonomonas sp. 216]NDW17485.1 DJ-1/PfpI family protein [Dysgonomonas sp. 216]